MSDRTRLRKHLLDISSDFTPPGAQEVSEWSQTRIASVIGSDLAYSLAASIRWIELRVDADTADHFADWLGDTLANGDIAELNADLDAD